MHNIVNNNNSIFDDIDTSKWLPALTNYRSDIHNAMRNLAIQLILVLLFEDSSNSGKELYMHGYKDVAFAHNDMWSWRVLMSCLKPKPSTPYMYIQLKGKPGCSFKSTIMV